MRIWPKARLGALDPSREDGLQELGYMVEPYTVALGQIFYSFIFISTLNSRMSRNMSIWRHKLCNGKTGVGPTFSWSNEPGSITFIQKCVI